MRILYDISVLGLARKDERARTGVHRVVENIANRIVMAPECDVTFCTSLDNESDCRDYLSSPTAPPRCNINFVDVVDASALNAQKLGFCKRMFARVLRPRLLMPVYHSLFFPIPVQVRRNRKFGKVQTIYDLVEILFPQLCELQHGSVEKAVIDSLSPETHIICISEATKNDLCNHARHIDPSRVFVTHLAASELFHPVTDSVRLAQVRHKFAIHDGMRYILSVSTLEPRKNVEQAIRSFVNLVLEQHIKDLCLVLTGTKGWMYDKIFAEIENAAEVKERIILTGFVSNEDLAPLYSGALAFVYPSFYEGFGLPPLEAMQCGTPVITSNTSSLPEVVGDAGLMVAPMDGDGLCQAMLDLYNGEELRKAFSAKAQKRASHFSWDRCVAETIAVYKRAANV